MRRLHRQDARTDLCLMSEVAMAPGLLAYPREESYATRLQSETGKRIRGVKREVPRGRRIQRARGRGRCPDRQQAASRARGDQKARYKEVTHRQYKPRDGTNLRGAALYFFRSLHELA